jgi:hypothetical protein
MYTGCRLLNCGSVGRTGTLCVTQPPGLRTAVSIVLLPRSVEEYVVWLATSTATYSPATLNVHIIHLQKPFNLGSSSNTNPLAQISSQSIFFADDGAS